MACLEYYNSNLHHFYVVQTTGVVDSFDEHTVYVTGNPYTVDEWIGYGIYFSTGEKNLNLFRITSNGTNSITCSGTSFTGQVFPWTFPGEFSELANSDIFSIIKDGLDPVTHVNATSNGPLVDVEKYLLLFNTNIDYKIPKFNSLIEFNYTFVDSYATFTIIFPKVLGWSYNPEGYFSNSGPLSDIEDELILNNENIDYKIQRFNQFFDFSSLYPLNSEPLDDASAGPLSDVEQNLILNNTNIDYKIPKFQNLWRFPYGLSDRIRPRSGLYSIDPLWGAFTLQGTITSCLGQSTANKTLRASNVSTGQYIDTTLESDGSYSLDLSGMSRIFSDGDEITVSTISDSNSFTLDYYYENPKTIDLNYCETVPTEVDVSNVMKYKIKRSMSERAGAAELIMENINGRRSSDYDPLKPITIQINNQTLFKGRVLDSDTSSNHVLKVTAEDNNGLLHNNYIKSGAYTVRTIRDIIVNTTDGLIGYYLPDIHTSEVPDNIDTQRTVTIKFEKISVADSLKKLGDITSDLGYRFYIDENKYFRFEERRSVDSGITLTNTGVSKSLFKWNWNDTGQDVYNRIVVYGAENIFPYEFPLIFGKSTTFPQEFPFQFGTRIIETIEDTESQAEFGVRDSPPYDDPGISSITEARYMGENILKLKGNPIKDIEVNGISTYKDHIFNYTFPIPFKMRSGTLDLQPGDLVKTNLVGTNLPQENLFPWTFTTEFTPKDRIIQEYEYNYPESTIKLKLLEYYKDISMVIARNRL